MTTSVLVFTRDLRVHDNPALAAAARGDDVVPLFVLDDVILRRHRSPTRLSFLLASLRDLDDSLRSRGGKLIVRRGRWARTVADVAAQAGATSIHVADDVSGYARHRLAELAALTGRTGLHVHPGVMVSAPAALQPAGDGPYQVFTPYYRRWLTAARRPLAAAPSRLRVAAGIGSDPIPALAELTGAQPATTTPAGGETAGRDRQATWASAHLADYERAHDELAADATSRLSPYLHLGCVSPLAVAAELEPIPGSEPFIRQLAWRDFFCQLLAARPDAARCDFRDRGDHWHDEPDALAAWQAGQTGYPVVDAAMRQLASEGFLPNRARMIVASFLTRDLGIDWRKGAAHFTALLADADVACNQLNWQWVAGTGTDPRRHRVFNPTSQGRRFDPRGEYVSRYVPELADLPASQVHDPGPAVRRARRYPAPILDRQAVASARRRGAVH